MADLGRQTITELTADIVRAYVANNPVTVGNLPALIDAVLARTKTPAPERRRSCSRRKSRSARCKIIPRGNR